MAKASGVRIVAKWKKKNKFAKGKNLKGKKKKELLEKLAVVYETKLDKSHVQSVFDESEQGKMSRDAPTVGTEVYGEITPFGVEKIVRTFGDVFSQEDTVFYDIGCGLGRMSCHIRARTGIKKVCGIELCPQRYSEAVRLADTVDWGTGKKPEFLNANMFDVDFSDATIAYIDNTGYSLEATEALEELLPPSCILIYKSKWNLRGDPSFLVETTYNKKIMKDGHEDKLFAYTYSRAGWRPAGGWEQVRFFLQNN